jgi:hypothetical protein
MSERNTAVFAMCRSKEDADHTVSSLVRAGFAPLTISVLLQDVHVTKEFAVEHHTKTPETSAASPLTAGGVIGGTLGVLVGLGALAIPGLGPLIAVGPIAAGLAGLGVGGLVGGFVGALVGMGVSESDAHLYEQHVREGGALVSVHCDSPSELIRAKDVLQAMGAGQIASGNERTGTISATDA